MPLHSLRLLHALALLVANASSLRNRYEGKISMDANSDPQLVIEFARFRVSPRRRELSVAGKPIELRGRAFDVLLALIEAHGKVLSKDQLMARVWPDRVVEENNLQVQIATLRKVLADDRELVRTVAGRGYQFTGELRMASVEVPVAAPPATNLPAPASELIGRGAELREVTDLVRAHRLVTLAGAGGIGKTRLSQEVGRELLGAYPAGVWIAELGPLSDPQLIPVTVATALGLSLGSGTVSPERVATALGSKPVLVLLDNCEHVIEEAARMADALLRLTSHASVIATSREPLRINGEYTYRVPSLEVPPEGTLDEDAILHAGAVRLFVARAKASVSNFAPDSKTIATIGSICRRLDGIPLAIELAAARAPVLGVDALAARLNNRFTLLTGGHRTALPRHQTLRATLDWSYELLPEIERFVLRRLGVFAGPITLASAAAVASDDQVPADDVTECIANLVAKSLVVAEVGHEVTFYRLLDTTRAYAIEKLIENGELADSARRHGQYHRELFEQGSREWESRPADEWEMAYARQVDNLRAALDWAFSKEGDHDIGIALVIAAVPLWVQSSLMEECRARVERARSLLGSDLERNARYGMQLYAALGLSLMYTRGTVPETRAALSAAREIAERLDDTDYRLRALWGLCVDRINSGSYRQGLALAETFCGVAARSPDPIDLPIGERMIGLALHYLGDQTNARRHFERMLSQYRPSAQRSHMIRFLVDQRAAALAILAEILWLQGFPDQAMRMVEENIEEATATGHATSLCNALAKACAVAIEAGAIETAERFLSVLLDRASRYGLNIWQAWGCCFDSMLRIRRGDVLSGSEQMRAAVSRLRESGFAPRYPAFLGELAHALGQAGQVADALGCVDEALAVVERNEERWCLAELLRIKGELLLLEAASNAPIAERHIVQGLEHAQCQGALSWQLRSAASLARLWEQQGANSRARDLLGEVYRRFTEGFETADLRSARALLEALE